MSTLYERSHDEDLEVDVCAVCGEEVDVADPSAYSVSPSMTVCYRCARVHRGVYDEELERWTDYPQLPSMEARWDDEN